jgi:hypothetical protein
MGFNSAFKGLTYICNLMITTGIFPTRLKFAEIKQIKKKGEMANIANYIPISFPFQKCFKRLFSLD